MTSALARFDRLRIKLFLAIAGVNAVLALAAYLIFSWSFDRGVIDYMHQTNQQRLDTLSVMLAQGYAQQGNWDWVTKDKKRWEELSRNALGLPPPPPEGQLELTVPEPPLTFRRRLLLFDAERKLLIGREDRALQAAFKDIKHEGRLIGYIGYIPQLEPIESLGRLYTEQQNQRFAALAIGMLAAALLLGAGLAYWLSLRIRTLGQGTAALIQGDYGIQLQSRGEDELAQLARDFNKLSDTLAANRQARSQWIADIAHELRTPLAVLRGEIEAIQDGVRPLNPTLIASLAQEANRLSRLVEDLHLLSSSDLGGLSYRFEPVDLREVIEETLQLHAAALQANGLRVRSNFDAAESIQGDAMRLGQVFANLLQNSLRYTDAPGELHIKLHLDNGNVIVEWQDSSPGVPEEDLPRLTERLFRVEGSRNRASGGAGLGLAIAQAIVLAHHGDMEASASPLGGLCWRLGFPAH